MRLLRMDYREYLRNPPGGLRFLLIDPPWKYPFEGSKLHEPACTRYEYWGRDNELELVGLLDSLPDTVDGVFVWTTNPMLADTFGAASKSKAFRFRSLLTWEKTTKTGKQAKAMAHYFMSCTEFLMFIVRKKPGSKINRTHMPTHFSGMRGERTAKPKSVEAELVCKLGGKWAYLFSGPSAKEFEGFDIDLVDVCPEEGQESN